MDNSSAKNFLLDLFFPKFCLGCRSEGDYLCQDCKELLDIVKQDYCLCEKAPSLPPGSLQGKCHKCQDRKLNGLYFALAFRNPLAQKLIKRFKYTPYIKELARPLSRVLAEHFIITGKNKDDIWQNSVLVPVPLDKRKIKSRGYNQSEELARELAIIFKLDVVLALAKIKTTSSQMNLGKKEREKNLKGAFVCPNAELIKDKKVFLVDDVYTTGCTMAECAGVLRKAGAKQVWGISIAREE